MDKSAESTVSKPVQSTWTSDEVCQKSGYYFPDDRIRERHCVLKDEPFPPGGTVWHLVQECNCRRGHGDG